MRTEKFDLVVVGGGPAGSTVARLAKKFDEDFDVVLFERGEEPAANCAGGTGRPWYRDMDLELPDHITSCPIKNVYIESPNEQVSIGIDDLSIDEEDMGAVVVRQELDNWLLNMAQERADVRRKHVVKNLEQKNNHVEMKVLDRDENEDIKVKSDYVALANGPDWSLAVQAGFNEDEVVPPKVEQHMGFQFHCKDPEYFDSYGHDSIKLLFDRDYASMGYVWSFPYNQEDQKTKWGLGIPLSEDQIASERMQAYMEDNGKGEYIDESDHITQSIIPTAQPLDSCLNGRVGLVGDCGHHTDPLHGGGVYMGSLAGREFARAATEGNISRYDEYWKRELLDTLQHRWIIRDLVYSMDNDEYDRFINSLKGFDVKSMDVRTEIPRLLWHSLKNDPGIFTKSAAESTKSIAKRKFLL